MNEGNLFFYYTNYAGICFVNEENMKRGQVYCACVLKVFIHVRWTRKKKPNKNVRSLNPLNEDK